eukprot:Seg16894.1 transcript_id=Seg16894.1/GoldUCD/mRNA.D3Y31 product="hypothetical protein" protein_id=Seg16894.1/GoldUCD/D3Y31
MNALHRILITILLTISTSVFADQKQEVMEALFVEREEKTFRDAVKKAQAIKIHSQIILEAEFLYYIDKEDYPAIITLTEKFKKQLATFNADHSEIFSTKEEWQSVIEYGLALKALSANDREGFKKHIKEAFWLSPGKASAFAHHIDDLRVQDAIKTMNIKPDRKLSHLEDDGATTFKDLLKNKNGLILRFWSPWSQHADDSYPLIEYIAKQSAPNNITFASLLIDDTKDVVADAKEFIKEPETPLASLWLVDSSNNSLTKMMRLQSLPTLVVFDKNGSIIYHGKPNKIKFWKKISTLSKDFKPPVEEK